MKEFLGLVGGLLGGLYAIGYVVEAGHARVLGLPVRTVEPSTLIGAAWEFLFRGSVIVILRLLESVTWFRLSLLLVVVVVVVVVMAQARLRTAIQSAFTAPATSSAYLALAIVSAILTIAQVWHFAERVIPTSAINSLLFNESRRSPFVGPSSVYLEPQWEEVQDNLLGNGTYAYTRELSRDYTIHVLITAISGLGAWFVWRASRVASIRGLRYLCGVPLVLGAILVGFTPFYYGAVLKSYQYPLVNVVAADKYDGTDLDVELRWSLSHSQFLLETTSEDFYLFDGRELHVLARSKVGLVKVIGEDFVFRKKSQ